MRRTPRTLFLTAVLATLVAAGLAGAQVQPQEAEAWMATSQDWRARTVVAGSTVFVSQGTSILEYDGPGATPVVHEVGGYAVSADGNDHYVAFSLNGSAQPHWSVVVFGRASDGTWSRLGDAAPPGGYEGPAFVGMDAAASTSPTGDPHSGMVVATIGPSAGPASGQLKVYAFSLAPTDATHEGMVGSLSTDGRLRAGSVATASGSVAVGLPGTGNGSVHTWIRGGGTWYPTAEEIPVPADSTTHFGAAVRYGGSNPDLLYVGDPGHIDPQTGAAVGIAHMFGGGNTWPHHVAFRHPGGGPALRSDLGHSISPDGGWGDDGRVLIGAPGENNGTGFHGATYLFSGNGTLLESWRACDAGGDTLFGDQVFIAPYPAQGVDLATGAVENDTTWGLYRLVADTACPDQDADGEGGDDDEDSGDGDDQDDPGDDGTEHDDQADEDDQDGAGDDDDEHHGDGGAPSCGSDCDNDGVGDGADNCPGTSNQDQADSDGDGTGDACDAPHDTQGPADNGTDGAGDDADDGADGGGDDGPHAGGGSGEDADEGEHEGPHADVEADAGTDDGQAHASADADASAAGGAARAKADLLADPESGAASASAAGGVRWGPVGLMFMGALVATPFCVGAYLKLAARLRPR